MSANCEYIANSIIAKQRSFNGKRSLKEVVFRINGLSAKLSGQCIERLRKLILSKTTEQELKKYVNHSFDVLKKNRHKMISQLKGEKDKRNKEQKRERENLERANRTASKYGDERESTRQKINESKEARIRNKRKDQLGQTIYKGPSPLNTTWISTDKEDLTPPPTEE